MFDFEMLVEAALRSTYIISTITHKIYYSPQLGTCSGEQSQMPIFGPFFSSRRLGLSFLPITLLLSSTIIRLITYILLSLFMS